MCLIQGDTEVSCGETTNRVAFAVLCASPGARHRGTTPLSR